MEERRKSIRRQMDRILVQKVQDLQAQVDRHGKSGRSEAEHARRRIIRHECQVGIAMKIGVSSGNSNDWSVDSIKIKGRILDLSPGGASLFTGQRFETGQELQLAIRLRDGSEIHTNAAVRWVKHVPEKGGYASGVQFSYVTPKDQANIAKFLRELDATVGL